MSRKLMLGEFACARSGRKRYADLFQCCAWSRRWQGVGLSLNRRSAIISMRGELYEYNAWNLDLNSDPMQSTIYPNRPRNPCH